MSAFPDFELTTTGRYGRMQEQYRLLVDEQLICGLQIHVGVSDRDLAVQIMQRIAADLPILLALSASSPYWNEQDTGLPPSRRLSGNDGPPAPPGGSDRPANDELITDLINTGVIADEKMAYFDVRPSAHADPRAAHLRRVPAGRRRVAIAGLFRAMVRAAERYRQRPPIRSGPAAGASGGDRACAARGPDGHAAGQLCHTTCPPVGDQVLLWRLRPQLRELGDWDVVKELVKNTLARGNSADRRARGIRRRRPARRRRLAR